MRVASNFYDYEIIDSTNGEKLERWGKYKLIRPDPQVIWTPDKDENLWDNFDAKYIRSYKGGGDWEYKNEIPQSWNISYDKLKFIIKPTGFKHTGLFPEQAVNWSFFNDIITRQKRTVKVLNLFAYTGGATLACAAAGAEVCHVDASKGIVSWAKENAILSSLQNKTIRYIVDDCEKFVAREIKRGVKYDAVIMDPPSYGRGPGGEIWKLEEHVYNMINLASKVLSENPLFFVINSYTTGLSPSVMEYILGLILVKKHGGTILSDEIGINVSKTGYVLPCGSTSIWQRK